ncbi:sulfatase [bacterium]|nr:sulfatase [bacterium]
MTRFDHKILISLMIASIPIVVFDSLRLVKIVSKANNISAEKTVWLLGLAAGAYVILALAIWLLCVVNKLFLAMVKQIILSSSLHENTLNRRIFQGIVVAIVVIGSGWLTRYFHETFHDPTMIKWALFIILGTITWITISALVLLEKTSPVAPSLSSSSSFSLLLHPLVLPGYVIAIAFIFNLSWIRHVIDIRALGLLLLWLLLSKIVYPRLKSRKLHTPVTTAVILCLLYPFFAFDKPQYLPTIKNHSVLIKYPMGYMLKNKTQGQVILSGANSEGSLNIDPVLPENFDLITWNKNNIQKYPFPEPEEIPQFKSTENKWNVVFLTIEALRSDHLSCYGYEYPTTPNIDQLAKSGVLFEANYTQGGDSIFSLNSILSGVLPWNYRDHQDQMLGTILQEHGISTGYVGYDYVLKGGAFREEFTEEILLEGNRREVWGQTTSRQMVGKIIELIDRFSDQQFFIYSHLLDPHADYVRNSETDKFEGSLHQAYDAEIAFTDMHIGGLINYLAQTNLLEKTVFIITADHGEEFKEHGHLWHGRFLYDESVRTPLIMSLPAIAGRRVKIPVGPVNIAPTIMSIMGLEPLETMDGINLLPLIYHGNPENLPVVEMYIPSGDHSKHGWVYGPWKFIENKMDGSKELYHLESDPGEKVNLI